MDTGDDLKDIHECTGCGKDPQGLDAPGECPAGGRSEWAKRLRRARKALEDGSKLAILAACDDLDLASRWACLYEEQGVHLMAAAQALSLVGGAIACAEGMAVLSTIAMARGTDPYILNPPFIVGAALFALGVCDEDLASLEEDQPGSASDGEGKQRLGGLRRRAERTNQGPQATARGSRPPWRAALTSC